MMRGILRAAALVVVSGALLIAAPANINGPWQFTVELAMGTGSPVVTFVQDGEKMTGTYEGRYGKFNLAGTVKENDVVFTVTMNAEGQTVEGKFVGVYAEEKMKGTVDYGGAGEGTWTAVKMPKK
jgi:hypothetical protein